MSGDVLGRNDNTKARYNNRKGYETNMKMTHSAILAATTVSENVVSRGTVVTVGTSDDATAAMWNRRRGKPRISFSLHANLCAGVAAILALFLFTQSGIAATYFRGNEVVSSPKPVATIERLTWSPSPDDPERERIQGVVSVIGWRDRSPKSNSTRESDFDERKDDYIVLVLQLFDVRERLLSSFSVVPKKRLSRSGGKGGFFADLPKVPNAFRIKVVNVVVGESEVQYSLRQSGNSLSRNSLRLPTDENWATAEFWKESEAGGWLPPALGSEKSVQANGKGNASLGEASFVLSKGGPPKLDVSDLVSSLKTFESGYGMEKTPREKFAAAIKKANLSSVEKWKKLGDAVSEKLVKMEEKAVSDGNLELTLKLESLKGKPLDVSDASGFPELKSMCKVVDTQSMRIFRELVSDGLSAAKALNDVLEGQKTAFLKKSSLESAKGVLAFQNSLQLWAKGIKGGDIRDFTAKATAEQPKSVKAANGATIVMVEATNIKGKPIGTVNPGDVIEIEFVGGKWCKDASNPWTSPDEDSSCSAELSKLLKVERTVEKTRITRAVLATIPCGTRGNPFRYTVKDDMEGELSLIMESPGRPGDGCAGFARYSVKIRKGAGASAWAE